MVSGFNHITITLGDDIIQDQPYLISDQVTRDIFNNDKLLYCQIVFPDALAVAFGKQISIIMTKLGDGVYANSIVSSSEYDIVVIGLSIAIENDEVYFRLSFKGIAISS